MAARKPIKLYKIGEVMEYTGMSRQTIHNYTMLGLIKPARRTKAGHRLYGEEVFEILERVKELKRDHTLIAIREILKQEKPRAGQEGNKDVEKSDQGRQRNADE
jgi:DNA-binding transcriptional MerR regulator